MNDYELEKWWHYARQQMAQGNSSGALESLRRILSIDPDRAEAHALLALVLLDQRRMHAAQHEANLALALEPELPLAHYANAQVLIAHRQFKAAEAHLKQLLAMDALTPTYYHSLATLYRITDRNEEIWPLLEKALEIDPESPDTFVVIGEYYLEQGNLKQAQEWAFKVLQLEAEHHDGLILMGHILLQQGQVESAREHALWALRQDPDNFKAQHLITAVKARQNLVLGLWWRYNTWMGALGEGRAILILVIAFVIYRIAIIVAGDFEQAILAGIIHVVWLIIVVYTWIGPVIFRKSLKKEIESVTLKQSF